MLADLHLHSKPDWRFIWNKLFLEKIQNAAVKNTSLILLGDVFEVADKVDSRVLNQFLDLVLTWSVKIGKVVWLTGQHDSYVPGKATLEALRLLPNIMIIDNDSYYDTDLDVWFIPFFRDLEDYRKGLKEIPSGTTVLTHMPLKEVLESYGAKNVIAVSVTEFARFKNVISGDIHKYETYDNFDYVGATSQRDWRDAGVAAKIGLLLGDNTLQRVDVVCPEHIKITNSRMLARLDKTKQLIIKITTAELDMKKLADIKKLPNVLDAFWEPEVAEMLHTEVAEEDFCSAIQSDEEVMHAHLEQTELPANTSFDELFATGKAIFDGEYT